MGTRARDASRTDARRRAFRRLLALSSSSIVDPFASWSVRESVVNGDRSQSSRMVSISSSCLQLSVLVWARTDTSTSQQGFMKHSLFLMRVFVLGCSSFLVLLPTLRGSTSFNL